MINPNNTYAFAKRVLTIVLFLMAISIFSFSCAPTSSKGLGLSGDGGGGGGTKDDLNQLGRRIIETYQSRGSIPEVGYKKVSEFSKQFELNSGEPCRYLIIESAVLVQVEPTVVIDYKYKQSADKGNDDSCPATDNHIVNYQSKNEFSNYVKERVAVFQNFSDASVFARNNAWVSGAQVIDTKSTTFKNHDVLIVTMKLIDHNNETYLLQTSFASMSSFLGVVDQKLVRTKDSERISFRTLISSENP